MTQHLPLSVRVPIEPDNPSIVRDEEKCIRCGMCKSVCAQAMGVHGTYTLEQTGGKAICIYCGQCANVCPPASITERCEYARVRKAMEDPEKVVVVSTSPAVRVALGEEFGLEPGTFAEGKMVALLRALGADYVLDTNFAADLTVVEEASELIRRITGGDRPLPQFTSCCPAWVAFAELYYPEWLPHLSTAKSPIGMQGPTVKTYFAREKGLDPRKIVNVALTPCTAKKFEIRREEMRAAAEYHGIPEMRDMDQVITTRELARWAREAGIDFLSLEDSAYDDIMGRSSGAGVIFGNTGGVMEAALRTAYAYLTGEKAPEAFCDLQPVRGESGIREARVNIGEISLNVAVVYGTANARELLRSIREDGKQYHFVEVMACPGGCIGGGGQPRNLAGDADSIRRSRIAGLYRRDASMALRASHENPDILRAYERFYGRPLGETAEKMLHTTYADRSDAIRLKGGKNLSKWICKICGYVYDEAKEKTPFADLPETWVCPLCGASKSSFAPEEQQKPKAPVAPVPISEDMKQLSAGELSALCSNLARGCEKQYKEEEAALFRELADFFAAGTPAIADADADRLMELVRRDLEEGYPALRSAAEAAGDRGTQRICVWGEKVTRILASLLERYRKEGDALLKDTQVWVCTVCGFVYVGDKAPEMCPVCKVPAWKFEKIEGRDRA
ncbi:MAG TPA: iron hydrogenase small subunit [Candidatus Pullichristensenella excrementigallinarum]|uniref:Iron hydrogenase small subunit n=1 Tax=Candidatus Pullichristensenella excrementigallinarum TaxID=2840907 RepID=A0A9D1IBV5_9FIRM|nr:iron hydrogenase small subunit [Candidatus Pullichristensenella excrementigallinarum]